MASKHEKIESPAKEAKEEELYAKFKKRKAGRKTGRSTSRK
jgi:hypothetical protein